MPRPLFLPLGKENPKLMVEGRARERAKKERRAESWERYYEMLKKRAEEEKLKPEIEEKAPRRIKTEYPVVNEDNPIIAARD